MGISSLGVGVAVDAALLNLSFIFSCGLLGDPFVLVGFDGGVLDGDEESYIYKSVEYTSRIALDEHT